MSRLQLFILFLLAFSAPSVVLTVLGNKAIDAREQENATLRFRLLHATQTMRRMDDTISSQNAALERCLLKHGEDELREVLPAVLAVRKMEGRK